LRLRLRKNRRGGEPAGAGRYAPQQFASCYVNHISSIGYWDRKSNTCSHNDSMPLTQHVVLLGGKKI
jgi:hypothetical protein